MRLLILLLIAGICIVSAKYLPDETNNSKQLLSRYKRSDSEESTTTEDENNSDDDDDDDDSPDQNEGKERSKLLAKIEKMRQKLLEKQEKERQKQEEAQRKLEEKVAKELRKEEEKRQKEERKREEKLEKERKKLEDEQRKIQQKLLENERKRQEKIQKQLEEITKNTSEVKEEEENSLESNDSIELKDFWKKHIYAKYGITEANTNLEKNAVFRRYIQEELGLNVNSTETERRQAVLHLVQNKLQIPSEQNTLRNELINYINVVGVQKIRANLEKDIKELNNKTEILSNVNLPWVPTAKQNLAEQVSFLQTIEQYLSNILPNWFIGSGSTSKTQVDITSHVDTKLLLSNPKAPLDSNMSTLQIKPILSTDIISANAKRGNKPSSSSSNNLSEVTLSGSHNTEDSELVSTVSGNGLTLSASSDVTNNGDTASTSSSIVFESSSQDLENTLSSATKLPVSINEASSTPTSGLSDSASFIAKVAINSNNPVNSDSINWLLKTITSSTNGILSGDTTPVLNLKNTNVNIDTNNPDFIKNDSSVTSKADGTSVVNNETNTVSTSVNKSQIIVSKTGLAVSESSINGIIDGSKNLKSSTTSIIPNDLKVVSVDLSSHQSESSTVSSLANSQNINILFGSKVALTDILSVQSISSINNTAGNKNTLNQSSNFSNVSNLSPIDLVSVKSENNSDFANVSVSKISDSVTNIPIMATSDSVLSDISSVKEVSSSGNEVILKNNTSPSLTNRSNAAEVPPSLVSKENNIESFGILKESQGVVSPGSTLSNSNLVTTQKYITNDGIIDNRTEENRTPITSSNTQTSRVEETSQSSIGRESTIVFVKPKSNIETSNIQQVTESKVPKGILANITNQAEMTIDQSINTNVAEPEKMLVVSTPAVTMPSIANTVLTASNIAVVNTQENIITETTEPASVAVPTTAAGALFVVSDTILNNSVSHASAFQSSSPPSMDATELTKNNKTVGKTLESVITETTDTGIKVVSSTAGNSSSIISDTTIEKNLTLASSVDAFSSSSPPNTNTTPEKASNIAVANTQGSIITETTEPATAMISKTAAGSLSMESDMILKNIVSSASTVDAFSSSSPPSTNATKDTTSSKSVLDTLGSLITETTEPTIVVQSKTAAGALSVVSDTILNNIVSTDSVVDAVSSSSPPGQNATEQTTSSQSVVNKQESIITETTDPGIVVVSTTAARTSSIVNDTILNNNVSPGSTVNAFSTSSPSNANATEVTSSNIAVNNTQESIIKETTEPAIVVMSTTAAGTLSVLRDTILNNIVSADSVVDALSSSSAPGKNATEQTTSSQSVVNKQESIITDTTYPGKVVVSTTATRSKSVVNNTILNNDVSPGSTVNAFSITSSSNANATEVTSSNIAVNNTQESIIKETTEPAIVVMSTTAAGTLSVLRDTILNNIVSADSVVDALSSSSAPGKNATEQTTSSQSVVNKQESIITETTDPGIVVVSTTAARTSSIVNNTILNNNVSPGSTVNAFSTSSPSNANAREVTSSNIAVNNTQESIIKETTEPAIVVVSTTAAGTLSVVRDTILNNIVSADSVVDALSSSSAPGKNATEQTTSSQSVVNKQERPSIITETTEPGIVVGSTAAASASSTVTANILNNNESLAATASAFLSSLPPNTNETEVTASNIAVDDTQKSIIKETTEPATVVLPTTAPSVLSVVSDIILSSLPPHTNETEVTASNIAVDDTQKSIIKETTEPATVVLPTTAPSVLSVVSDIILSSLPPNTNETEVTASNIAVDDTQKSIIKETTEPATVVLPTTAPSVLSVVSDIILKNIVAPTFDALSSSLPTHENATKEPPVLVTKENNIESSHTPIETLSTASQMPNASNSNNVFSKVDNLVTVTEAIRIPISFSDAQASVVRERVAETNQTIAGKQSTDEIGKVEGSSIQKLVTESEVLQVYPANISSKAEISTEQSIITNSTEPETVVAPTGTEGNVLNVPIKVKEIPIINVQVPLEQGASVVDIAKQ